MPALATLIALLAPLIVPTGSALAQGMVPTLPSLDPYNQRPLAQGNITPNSPQLDFSWNPWMQTQNAVVPGLPDDLVFYQITCVTPDGYCQFKAPTPVDSGSQCYCDASQLPGLTR